MAVSKTLAAFLTKSRVKYKGLTHPAVYTAQEIAAAQHVPGKQLAKCVLVTTDKGFYLAVLPAIHLIDFDKLKRLLRVKKLSLAKEADIKTLFPDAEVGAMSVFGNLYNVPVAVDKALGESADMVCNAGSHTQTIKLRYADFERLVKPKVGPFGLHIAKAKGKATPAKRKPSKGKKKSTR